MAAVGEDKCDRGRHAAFLLRRMGFTVIESRFPEEEFENRPLVFSRARHAAPGQDQRDHGDGRRSVAAAAAARALRADARLLGSAPARFPDSRSLSRDDARLRVGALRRGGAPARSSSSNAGVDEGVPTVFFTQSFCAKQDLAHYLAEKHRGLAVDCHREINDSILAKVEAFLKLS